MIKSASIEAYPRNLNGRGGN